jgi:hypothetical protein
LTIYAQLWLNSTGKYHIVKDIDLKKYRKIRGKEYIRYLVEVDDNGIITKDEFCRSNKGEMFVEVFKDALANIEYIDPERMREV